MVGAGRFVPLGPQSVNRLGWILTRRRVSYRIRVIVPKRSVQTLARLGVGKKLQTDILLLEKRTGRDASDSDAFGGVFV